ncbi:MAG: indole-3-glycerol phosphate synthase TrpC [Bacteroidetes bacterium]|nr:indole-3-glycerol phosphate synthase TrpC [Bacteroidota bacterium]
MNILEKIASFKEKEVAENRSLYPVKLLERSIYFETKPVSLRTYLLDKNLSGVIAEFKRKSPSKGNINPYAPVGPTTLGYMQAGASALSILTDKEFFGGSSNDLTEARRYNYCPILRKDFIIDEYQIIEAKSIGADAILLIGALLTKEKVKQLSDLAVSFGMEVLFEIHDETDMVKLNPSIIHVGINNRNLENFEVDTDHALRLAEKLPKNVVKIAESGISKPEQVLAFRNNGFKGFLIGEQFMKESRPGLACKKFIRQLNAL